MRHGLLPSGLMLIISAVMLFSCSTEKDTYLNKKFHNTTAHYNVWWNGNESLKEAIAELNDKVADDYTKILPIYRLGDKQEALTVAPKLDRAIEKGTKGVQKHSMTSHGKEQIEYVKRCYLLTAYAYFYKQEYLTAASTCRFIMGSYNGTVLADEAKVLYARCMAKEGQYGEAEMILDQMDADLNTGKVAKETAPLLYPALAELSLAQEKYKKAIDNLRLSVDNTRDRKFKARLYFIMAQVYHNLGKTATATKYYKMCLKKRPAYVMEFNAQMNIAACYDKEKGDYKSILKMLDKMLKEKKNYEYRDQIYYAKGEMYLNAKDMKKACDNYRMSVEVSTNKSQKTKSAVKLGKVLYEEIQNYDESQKYYDTAVSIMPADYPFANKIKERHKILTSLVKHTRLIERNDSLIRMADMDSLDREKYIKKLIAEAKKKEQERIEAELIAAIKANSSQQNNMLKGDWYFYNSSTMQRGKESFLKNWGARALEDFWFLSKKNSMSFGTDAQSNSGGQVAMNDTTKSNSTTKVINAKDDKFSREYYLKDLPKTQAERDTMNKNTASSLLIAGFIYNDGIKNYDKALECFLRIAKEFPESDNVLPAFYQLYKLYDKQGNTPSANYYKNMILRGFPDSDYANLIQDEDYYLEIAKRSKMSEKEYADIYNLYNRRRYNDVITKASSAVTLYKDEKLTPKFKFWEALSHAKLGETTEAIAMLEEIVAKHPKSDIVPTAKEQIALLKKGNIYKVSEPKKPVADTSTVAAVTLQTPPPDASKNNPSNKQPQPQAADEDDELPPEAQMYRLREDMQHYVIILLDDRKIKATEMQYTVSDFNMEFFGIKGLRTNTLLFNETQQLLTVNRFANMKEAMEYYAFITKDGGALSKFDKADYKVFAISIQNYQTFYNQKNTPIYEKFFKKYYKDK